MNTLNIETGSSNALSTISTQNNYIKKTDIYTGEFHPKTTQIVKIDLIDVCEPTNSNNEVKPEKSGLIAINIAGLLALEIEPRENIISPIIPAQGLCMLYASRGIGKTYVAISLAYCAATGGEMFNGKWKCDKACKVLIIDGEMPVSVLQSRFASIVADNNVDIDPDNLQIITPDLQEMGIPDLSTREGQAFVEAHLDGVKLLILDNLSALCRTGKENDSESWLPMQEFLLSLRKRGISVLMIHHANKSGGQRGTSKREDLLDTVIELKRSQGYDSKDGARFEVHYTKNRDFCGDESKAFEAWLTGDMGKLTWKIKELEDLQLEEALNLEESGLTQREVASVMGISPSSVNRLLKKAKQKKSV